MLLNFVTILKIEQNHTRASDDWTIVLRANNGELMEHGLFLRLTTVQVGEGARASPTLFTL